MKPIEPVLPGMDLPVTTYAKTQSQYLPLPCYRSPDGMVTTRWKLSWKERLQVLFGGCVWLSMLTFNKPLQPVMLYPAPPEIPVTDSVFWDGGPPLETAALDDEYKQEQAISKLADNFKRLGEAIVKFGYGEKAE